MENQIKHLYIVFSQGYFLPGASLVEPFLTKLNWINTELKKYSQQRAYDGIDYVTGFRKWQEKAPFVPHVGKISFDPSKNSNTHLLLGSELFSPKHTFWSSREFSDCFHIPVSIDYRKKIRLKPSFSEYSMAHQNTASGQTISQDNRLYIHLFPYGLCFFHLAVSINASYPMISGEIISWLRACKKGANQDPALQVLVEAKGFTGTISDFFMQIWDYITAKVFLSGYKGRVSTSLIDSIRIESTVKIKRKQFIKYIDLFNDETIWDLKNSPYSKEWIHWFFDANVDEKALDRRYSQIPEYMKKMEWKDKFWLHWGYKPDEAPNLSRGQTNRYIIQMIRKSQAINLDKKEIAGFLEKRANFSSLAANEAAYSSKFGKYEGDFFLPKSQSMLFIYNDWSRKLRNQFQFHWRLLAVAEIVYAQRLILSYYWKQIDELIVKEENRWSWDRWKFSEVPEFPFQFLSGLANLAYHLPPHYRKWYYAISDAVSLPSQVQKYQGTVATFKNLQRYYNQQKIHAQTQEAIAGFNRFLYNRPVEIEETRYYEFKEVTSAKPIDVIKNNADEYAVAFLNSEGGRVFWGIRNSDRVVVGVKLNYEERDLLRRLVSEKLFAIQPEITPSAFRINIHQVYGDDKVTMPDLYVIELVVPRPFSNDLYFTSGNEAFIKTDAGKKKLTGPAIQDEIKRRNSIT